MPELPNEEHPSARPRELDQEVGTREVRKIRARREKDRTLWFGLGLFGLIGWSVAIPTLLGVALGIWLDMTWPGSFSWTLALLLAGAALGALNAWYWVSQEQAAMEHEREQETHE
jgi:ATP synthase protein I